MENQQADFRFRPTINHRQRIETSIDNGLQSTSWQRFLLLDAMIVNGDYDVPPFPSLYSPIGPLRGESKYLAYTHDVWRFTLFWTLLLYGAAHLIVALCAVYTQWRSWKIIWAVPVLYLLVATLEALLAGSLVGLL